MRPQGIEAKRLEPLEQLEWYEARKDSRYSFPFFLQFLTDLNTVNLITAGTKCEIDKIVM